MTDQLLPSEMILRLAEHVALLRNPQGMTPDVYRGEMNGLKLIANALGYTDTLGVAKSCDNTNVYPDPVDAIVRGHIHRALVGELKRSGRAIADAVYRETAKEVLIRGDANIPDALLSLGESIDLEDYQEALRTDAEMCLRARQYRPAIVMAWALCFDLFRRWLHDDSARLAAFNQWLKGDAPVKADDYRDFFRIGEGKTLDTCCKAEGALACFKDNHERKLRGLLDERNSAAHANFDDVSEEEAKSFVTKAIRVVTSKPFK